MISWIQRYFQRHFKVVFFVVLIAVALPMVVIYGSGSGGGGHGDIKMLDQKFFNVNLAKPEEARRVGLDGELSVFLRVGYPALQGAQLQQYALQRVAGLALADELHLPSPTPEQVAKFVPTLRAFQNPQGQFDQAMYTRFADSLKAGAGATAADVNRVLRDDLRLTELTKLVGGPGYLHDADIKRQLTRLDSTWTAQVAALDYASFNLPLNPSDDTLKKFQADNSFRYEVPVRPRLSLIEFKAADFTPPNGPSEADLRAFYSANMDRFPVPPEAEKKDAPSLDPTAAIDNFPKVRDQVDAAMRASASRHLASQAANQLTVALYERRASAPANSPQLAEFLTAQRRTAVAVAPFTADRPPADRPWLGNYASAIAGLNKDRFFSDPLPTPDGFVVLLWNESLPGYTPQFTEVRERVLADYKESEKRRLFIERGNAVKAQLQAAAASNGFADKAAAEKLEVKSYASFTLRTPPEDFPRNALEALSSLEKGQVSNLITTDEKAYIVYAQDKKLPDLTATNPRYTEIQKQFATMLASAGENAILGELTEEELKRSDTSAMP